MLATIHGERTLTELDFVRLGKLQDQQLPPALTELLDAADVLPSREVPPDIVTMNSQVEVEDPATHQRQKITLCYPGDAQPGEGFVSVLSPAGIGLLGVRTGTLARWQMPNGAEGAARVVAVLFQPEANGEYTR